MSDLKMNKEDGVESYEFATPEAIEEAFSRTMPRPSSRVSAAAM